MPAATPERSAAPRPESLADQLEALSDWVARTSQLTCTIGPRAADAEPGLWLETIKVSAADRGSDPTVARVDAEILVAGGSDEHQATADAIASLLLQIIADRRWDLAPNQPNAELWQALSHRPRPAFVISVPLRKPLTRTTAPRVRETLVLHRTSLRRITGRVLAPNGTPLAGAVVRLHPHGRPATTDHAGRWLLTAPDTEVQINVAARGIRVQHPVPGPSELDAEDIDVVLTDLRGLAETPKDDQHTNSREN